MKVYALLFVFFLSQLSFSQNKISGSITDSRTKEPLSFVTIAINDGKNTATVTDINGQFSLHSSIAVARLIFSHIGYEKKILAVTQSDLANPIIIELHPLENNLEEVVIKNLENPAHAIIRKVVANRDRNNPENIASYKYTTYNKLVYDFDYPAGVKRDSIKHPYGKKDTHLFMTESVSEKKFIKPDLSEEVVTGSKMSGFKDPRFAIFSGDWNTVSFYRDNIKILEDNYLNPISKGSFKKYRFRIEDTIYHERDTTYAISYKPIPQKNFNGLEGILYINTNKYALQSITAMPAEKSKIDIKIHQQYAFVANKYWFPKLMNFTFLFNQYPSKTQRAYVTSKSQIKNVEVDLPMKRNEFPLLSMRIDKDAYKKDSLFWQNFRTERLTQKESGTYTFLDSVGEKHNFDKILKVTTMIMQGRIPVKKVDIDLSKTIVFNKYEGMRLGTGLVTNDKLFKNFYIGAFFGYGLKDYDWKYGGHVAYDLNKSRDIKVAVKYQHNLAEAGNYGFDTDFFGNRAGLRNFIGNNYDFIDQTKFNFSFRTLRYLKWNIGLSKTWTVPKYEYAFVQNGNIITSYNNSELSVNLIFAYKEKIVEQFDSHLSLGTNYPVLYLTYSKGLPNVLNGDLDYNRFEGRLFQSFFTKNVGTTRYRLEGGYIDRPVPYGFLFTGEGGFNGNWFFDIKNTFKTMMPYEFLSDKYVNLFLSHEFGSLLFKSPDFQPRISVHNNFGWGDLANKEAHQLIDFKVKNKLYLETGIQFDNILTVDYGGMGSLGYGAGVYYRYGAYSHPNSKDNTAFTFSTVYTFK